MKKGVYCLEGIWEQDLKNKSSVLPILELLERRGVCDYIYHDCATREELEYYLKRWRQKPISSRFPILYLAFHGNRECIFIQNDCEYTLKELGIILESECERKVIFFASCDTLDMHGNRINSFLQKTNALAAIGYQQEVDWVKSTAFELLVLNALQEDEFDSRGINKMGSMIKAEFPDLCKDLDFRIVINKEHYPRRRKKKQLKVNKVGVSDSTILVN